MRFSSVIWFSTCASVSCLLKLYHCCSAVPRRKWFCSSGAWKKSSAEEEGKFRGEKRTDETWLCFYGGPSPMKAWVSVETWRPPQQRSLTGQFTGLCCSCSLGIYLFKLSGSGELSEGMNRSGRLLPEDCLAAGSCSCYGILSRT